AEPIVDEERRTALQPVGQRADEGFGLLVDLGQVVVVSRYRDRRSQRGGTIDPREPFGRLRANGFYPFERGLAKPHAALVPDPLLSPQQLDWHGIQHFVADHDAAEAGRQLADPPHPISIRSQRLLLALAQAAG